VFGGSKNKEADDVLSWTPEQKENRHEQNLFAENNCCDDRFASNALDKPPMDNPSGPVGGEALVWEGWRLPRSPLVFW